MSMMEKLIMSRFFGRKQVRVLTLCFTPVSSPLTPRTPFLTPRFPGALPSIHHVVSRPVVWCRVVSWAGYAGPGGVDAQPVPQAGVRRGRALPQRRQPPGASPTPLPLSLLPLKPSPSPRSLSLPPLKPSLTSLPRPYTHPPAPNKHIHQLDENAPGPKILCIALPSGIEEVKRFETSRYVIFDSVRHGFAAAYDALVLDPALRGKGWEVGCVASPL